MFFHRLLPCWFFSAGRYAHSHYTSASPPAHVSRSYKPLRLKSSSRRLAASWETLLHRAPSPVMAPHLTNKELDWVVQQARSGKTPSAIHDLLETKRRRRGGMVAPHITNISKAIKCKAYQRGRHESRGRKTALNRRTAGKLNTVRKKLLKKAKSFCGGGVSDRKSVV